MNKQNISHPAKNDINKADDKRETRKFGINSTLLYAMLYSVCVGFIIATVVCCGVFEGGRKKYDKQESSQPTIMENQ